MGSALGAAELCALTPTKGTPMTAFPSLSSLRPGPRAGLRAFLVGLALTLALVPFAHQAWEAPPDPLPAPTAAPAPSRTSPSDEALLQLALDQARRNCLLVGRQIGSRGAVAWVPLRVDAIQRALATERIEGKSYGELPSIRVELRWLGKLERGDQLGARNLEDLRFLTGAIHWYLEGARRLATGEECHLGQPPTYDPDALQEFRDLEYSDLLSEWD